MEIRRLFIYFVCIIALISAVNGDISGLGRSEITTSDQIHAFQHPPSSPPFPEIVKHDTTLVVAPDGTISLMGSSFEKVIWSFSSGPSIYSAYQALPNREGGDQRASSLSDSFFIDLGQDWELYMHINETTVLKLDSAEEFIRHVPYEVFGATLLGMKDTTIFHVDPKSGSVISTFRSAALPSAGDMIPAKKPIVAKKYEEWQDIQQVLHITRTDYTLNGFSQSGRILWHLKFAIVEASVLCQASEKSFGGGFSKGDELCHTTLPVYRINKHLKTVSVPSMLEKFPPRHRTLPLPVININKIVSGLPIFGTEYPLSLPGGEDGETTVSSPVGSISRALSVAKTDFPLSLRGGEPIKTALSTSPKYHPSSHVGSGLPALPLPPSETENLPVVTITSHTGFFVPPFVLLLCSVFVLFRRGHIGKLAESNLKGQNLKVQATHKKKKARKPGSNKNNSMEKKPKNVLDDISFRGGSGPLDIEKIERKFQLAFDCVDDVIAGRKVGKLFVSNKEIAKGSNGTTVLEGIHDGRPVAVKRLIQTYHDVALKEIQNLIASDQHPNIVRWYGVEFDQDFVYLSLERCTCSLHELISSYSNSSQDQLIVKAQGCNPPESDVTVRLQRIMDDSNGFELWKPNGYPSPQLLKLMSDLVHGLAHLHELGIIHRDLKPQNVLIRKERSLCAKVSDMGISKRLAGDMTSLTKQTTGYGSSGWQAPEQLLHERQTRSVDLFSLGCVLFYCITGGRHPFGDILERDSNIVNNKKDLFLIETLPEALDLVSRLLDPNPELRPKAVDILHHPFFWSHETRLSFLRDVSDRVELEDRETNSDILKALESIGTVALNGKWDEKMENAFINDIGRYRRYKYDSVRDLLRVIRNKLNHYRELTKEIQGILGAVPEGFDGYFSSRFPKLLIEVYKVLYRYCREEESLHKYFKSVHI